MAKRRLAWVDTTGGPHLVVPEKYAVHWEGVGKPSRGRVVEAKSRWDASGPATDYDRACDVDGLLGVIRVGRGRGVVLADDPGMAAYCPSRGRHSILKWVYAPSEAALLACFRGVTTRLKAEATVSVRHPGGRLVLMDAADTPQSWLGKHSEFTLPAGLYQVTAVMAEAVDYSLIAYEWRRVRA